jgi:hypothetical protein
MPKAQSPVWAYLHQCPLTEGDGVDVGDGSEGDTDGDVEGDSVPDVDEVSVD